MGTCEHHPDEPGRFGHSYRGRRASARSSNISTQHGRRKKGDLDTAIREYEAVVRMQPGIAEVYANLGLDYQMSTKPEEAAQALRKAPALTPGLRCVNLFLGIDYVKLNHPAQAIVRLRRALQEEAGNKEAAKAYSSDRDVLFLLGEAYQKAANQEIEQVLALAVRKPLYHQAYGDIYRDQGIWDRAEVHYRRALQEDPKWPGAHLARYNEAQEFITAALKRAREPYPLYMRLGSVQMMASQYNQARESFQKAVDEHPELSVGYVALAQICFKKGQDEKAEKLLANARHTLKPDFLLEYYYGPSLKRLGKQDEAIAAFERAVALNRDVAEIHYELGKLYFETKRLDAARAELAKSIHVDPHFSKSYVFLSRIYVRLGDSEKAHLLANQAKRLQKDERDESVRCRESRLKSFQLLPVR